RLHHADRPRGARAIEHEGGRQQWPQARLRLGIELAFADLLEIARDAQRTVRVDAAQIGPGEHLGDRRGVRRAHPLGDEDPSGKAVELGVVDANVVHRKTFVKEKRWVALEYPSRPRLLNSD